MLQQARYEQQQEDCDASPAGSGAVGGTEAGRQRFCAQKEFPELKAFKAVRNKVEQIKKTGHLCIFLPEHHPVLITFEWYWGHAKHLFRLHCRYSLCTYAEDSAGRDEPRAFGPHPSVRGAG